MLRERGITRVRPLAGGFKGWQQHTYPVESRVYPEEPASVTSEK